MSCLQKKEMQSLTECVRSCAFVEEKHAHDAGISTMFLESAFVSDIYCFTSISYDRSRSKIMVFETGDCLVHE